MYLSCSTIGGLRSTHDDYVFLEDQIRTLDQVRNAGYEYVEVFMNERIPEVVQSVIDAIVSHSLNPVSIHLPKFLVMYDKDDFKRTIEIIFSFVRNLGVKTAVLHPPVKRASESPNWTNKLESLLTMGEETGCTITLENVPYIQNVDDYIVEHLRMFRDRGLAATLDFEYLHISKTNLSELFDLLGESLQNVHCRDSDGNLVDEMGKRKYLNPGSGSVDFRTNLEVLRDGGYRGPLTVEVSYRKEENISRAKQFM
ncbi:MAG: sugar phosphate isomerase/epimerase family protein, partial [Promethearchaeota archaeon]